MKEYIYIDDIKVDTDILVVKFACDYTECKGACCHVPIVHESLVGGNLLSDEATAILFNRKELSKFCSKESKKYVKETPVEKHYETYHTAMLNGRCALCNLEKNTCALKLANKSGIDDLDIPLSCQLYPICYEYSGEGEIILTLDTDSVFKNYCKHGYIKGHKEGIYLIDFLKDALIRGYGEEFFNKLKEAQNS